MEDEKTDEVKEKQKDKYGELCEAEDAVYYKRIEGISKATTKITKKTQLDSKEDLPDFYETLALNGVKIERYKKACFPFAHILSRNGLKGKYKGDTKIEISPYVAIWLPFSDIFKRLYIKIEGEKENVRDIEDIIGIPFPEWTKNKDLSKRIRVTQEGTETTFHLKRPE